ncbi:RhoGAP domain containing protein [Tritrichomonas foetus]|uniref:RhoGAP domain containing protein n=1 Tax=Tritrichomonas foetus TaxID=1144522 RepID=A0A1J4KPR5_9EUKA|nr:RhoGAP domain containing protein [Tritrichomonas foetus]|eukprot:OHT12888.1 RhoGAP domain containing protein [Tritrichomonas foetus]
MSNIYFVYYDKSQKLYYYYNNATQETTYNKPKNAQLLDPKTSEPFVFPEPTSKVHKKQETVLNGETIVPSNNDRNVLVVASNAIVYFVYVDADKELYYYNPDTQVSTYNKPQGDFTFLDPDTMQPYVFPESAEPLEKIQSLSPYHSPMKSHEAKPRKNMRVTLEEIASSPKRNPNGYKENRSSLSLAEDATAVVSNVKHESPDRSKSSHIRRLSMQFDDMPRPDVLEAVLHSLPLDSQQEIHQFKQVDFAKRFFKKQRKSGIFSRKKLTIEELSSFQNEPICEPLLKSLPKNLKDQAVLMFKNIIAYTGAKIRVSTPKAIDKIVEIVNGTPELHDELYAQLIKQSSNNPNDECRLRTWELFLVAATLFPSSRDSEIWIRSYIRESMKNETGKVKEYANYTFIRFCSRCSVGKAVHFEGGHHQIVSIIRAPYECNIKFGASIEEQLWAQKRTHPKFPVPYILHELTELLLAKGAEKFEGIFRIVGNMKNVEKMINDINKGKPIDTNANITDISSLMKAWFERLPERVINNDLIPELLNAYEIKKYHRFVAKLSPTHQITLKFLIGFLKKLIKCESVTKMNAKNFAICFAPNMINMDSSKDPFEMKKFSNIATDFLVTLMERLPTDDIYPAPPQLL